MQNIQLKKRNIISIAVIVVLAAIAALVCALSPHTASAEGNGAGSSTIKTHMTINLNLNGRDSRYDTSVLDSNVNAFGINNALNLRVRTINRNAIVDSYVANETSVSGINASDYKIFGIQNGSTAVSVTPTNGDETEGFSDIIVTALKVTSARGGRFSVLLKNVETDAEITVNCAANVSDTFVQLGSTGGAWSPIADNDKKILVGGTLDSAYIEDENVVHDNAGNHTAIMQVYNNTQLTIGLDKYLQNRALYCKANRNDADYNTPIVMGTTDKKWGVSSVSNFRITSVSFADMANAFSTAVCSDPSSSNRIPPSATVDVKITSSAITSCNKYTGLAESEKIKRFWSETHNVSVTFQEITGNTSYTIIIPTVFFPNKPLNKQISSELLRLDVTAPYTRDLKTLKFTKNSDGAPADETEVTGYNSIIIRADDLIEYSYPGDGDGESDPDNWGRALCFSFTDDDKQSWLTSSDYTVEIPEGEDAYRPFKIKITAKANGNITLNFNVQYFTAKGDDNIAVKPATVSLVGYGSYTVVINSIAGKKAVTYNIFSANSPFYELLSDGYQLTDIKSNSEYLDAKLHSDNTVTLTPMVDKIDGQASDVTVWMEFTNSDGRTIYLTSRGFNIDINAGSFWRQFEDWQAILIIIGICIGGIAIILFIVWMFIRAVSKRRQEENLTMAPVSSYIIKLNSTIAATQAQQRMAATQALSQSQMLLGAGATSTPAPDPNMLALGAGAGDTTPPPSMSMPGSAPAMSTPGSEPSEDIEALIAKYITDEELLERIFTEKYEPKGMVRRTFFKSKELQARELEKEKKRIIERYNSPMPMDEAIMSESEVQKAESLSTPSSPRMSEPAPQTEAFVLNFDPDSPLYTPEQEPAPDEFAAERIEDISPEESALRSLEKKYAIVVKELEELGRRLDNVQSELDKNNGAADDLRERITSAEAADEQFGKDIEGLEFSLASAKQKDKERIKRDIGIKEEKKARNLDELAALRTELGTMLDGGDTLNGIKSKLDDTKSQKDGEEQELSKQLEKARAEFEAYQIRLAKVKARQELDAKVESLSPLLVDVNTTNFELKKLEHAMEQLEKERDALKSDVATAKSQILGANDFDIINDLNTRISDANARLSDIEKEVTKSTKRKSELNIEFNAQRRKANDYVEKNEIPLEEVIAAEDLVIGNIELDHLKGEREVDRAAAEQRVAEAHAVYDDLSASSADVTMVAMDIAAEIKDIEDAIAEAQSELDAVNAQMETAGDDEKLMLMVDQGDKTDKIEELKEKLKQANVEGTKRKMEAQSEYDGKLEEAKAALDEANEEFKAACARYDALVDNTNPVDLITSGSGVISQDQKKFEAENYKKLLEKQKAEAEQARLAAQLAEEAAEKARQDAAREAEDAKAEAERKAQEAIAEAEAARLEAEEKARLEAEAAENARREAEEMAENARREAEEAAENARREAEEMAENARREAEEAAENARREAEESAETARREAEEAAAAEAEEAKRKAQAELDEMRRQAEEEAERARREEADRQMAEAERERVEAERKEAIAKKVAARKERIINFRDRMKDVKGEEDAKNLREQLYTFQLSFDEDEHGSSELMDFYNKTMDDIQHAGEIATLKAENAKKPQRVVKKVTERVNRIPKKKAGARPARPGARPSGARPSGARPAGARPAGARPSGARPAGARPSGARPAGARPSGARPASGARRPAPRPPKR